MSNEYKHVLMGDTDSSYVRLDLYAKAHNIEPTQQNITKLADNLQVRLQSDLSNIIADRFITSPRHIAILEPGRETVGRRGLFKNKKKRYAIHVVDNEGYPTDKLKIMGMETRRSDTPVFIQEFLTDCLTSVVKYDAEYDDVKIKVDKFRAEFRAMDPWKRGSPGRVRNLNKATKAFAQWQKTSTQIGSAKPRMHITVKAALNTNRLMEAHNEHRWDKIRDGDKVEVIYLKDNPEEMDSIAIKVGETYIPDWFKELPFDIVKMEEKLLDRKLYNVLGDVLEWDFTPSTTYANELGQVMDDFYD